MDASFIRKNEIITILSSKNEFMIRVSRIQEFKLKSVLGFMKTTFVCILLVVISLVIQRDAQDLVLNPIESIMEKLNRMA